MVLIEVSDSGKSEVASRAVSTDGNILRLIALLKSKVAVRADSILQAVRERLRGRCAVVNTYDTV